MSARSRDIISAVLITEGIPMAGEVHLAAGPSTTAFGSYWNDWFDGDRYHNSTNDISVGLDAMSSGRYDVLMVGPGDHLISTSLAWNKSHTHMIGVGPKGINSMSVLRLGGTGALSPMVSIASSACLFSNLKIHHGRAADTDAGCAVALLISTAARGCVVRDTWIHTPDDAAIAASTYYVPLYISGRNTLFERMVLGRSGYRYTGWEGGTSTKTSTMILFDKANVTSHFKDCLVSLDSTQALMSFMQVRYSLWGGTRLTFENTQFSQASSESFALGIAVYPAASYLTNKGAEMIFDANSFFTGVTDIANVASEGSIFFASAAAPTTGVTGARETGIAVPHDHT